jgi:hypothetical protein
MTWQISDQALFVRQILQSALVVCGGNLRRFAPNFSHRCLSLTSPGLPLGRMHEVFGGSRTRNPV